MEKIKYLTVKVTYRVGLGDFEMPENVYYQLKEASENGQEMEPNGLEFPDAAEWLANNIREGDCTDWWAEIEEFS